VIDLLFHQGKEEEAYRSPRLSKSQARDDHFSTRDPPACVENPVADVNDKIANTPTLLAVLIVIGLVSLC
jgi:hypothetical protein